jgi:hypothetical protein
MIHHLFSLSNIFYFSFCIEPHFTYNARMARKKSTTHHTFWTYELQNILAGGILVTLGVLMFLATREASVFGRYLTQVDMVLFGTYHRLVAAPILVILGVMILVKKASWSISRFAGILLFYIAMTSLIGWYTAVYAGDVYASFFNVWSLLERFLGRSSGFLFLIVLFFASLYLTLRISYRTILSRVRDSVPSMSRMREAILPTDDDEDEVPVKRSKTDDLYKKKAEELERKIAELHKGKKVETPVHEPK